MARNKGATNKNVEVAVNTQNAAVVSSPVVSSNGAVNMNANIGNTISALWNNREVYVAPDFVPALSLTEDVITGMSHVGVLNRLVDEKRIGLTQVPNLTRENGTAVIWQDKFQMFELGAALANIEFGIHDFGIEYAFPGSDEYEIGLSDRVGSSNYIVKAEKESNGHLRYTTWYARKTFNDAGSMIDFSAHKAHPVEGFLDDSILYGYTAKDGTHRDGYNVWVANFNAQAKEFVKDGVIGDLIAKNVAELKAEGVTDPNVFAQRLNRYPINRKAIANRFVLESWLLRDESRPAFSIFARNKSEESFVLSMNARNVQMLNGYLSTLRFLSGLRRAEAVIASAE